MAKVFLVTVQMTLQDAALVHEVLNELEYGFEHVGVIESEVLTYEQIPEGTSNV